MVSFSTSRAVLQPQAEAAHPKGLGHVRDSQRTVLLLHVQLRRRAGDRLQAASGEQAAQSKSVGVKIPPRDGEPRLQLRDTRGRGAGDKTKTRVGQNMWRGSTAQHGTRAAKQILPHV